MSFFCQCLAKWLSRGPGLVDIGGYFLNVPLYFFPLCTPKEWPSVWGAEGTDWQGALPTLSPSPSLRPPPPDTGNGIGDDGATALAEARPALQQRSAPGDGPWAGLLGGPPPPRLGQWGRGGSGSRQPQAERLEGRGGAAQCLALSWGAAPRVLGVWGVGVKRGAGCGAADQLHAAGGVA